MASSSISRFSTSSQSIPSDPPPTSSILESFPHEVFLSFRGKDTRKKLISLLYDRLVEANIRTFLDDDELDKEGKIPLQLMRAIKESRIYIVVFSKNYASSRWCLNELVNILRHCERNRDGVLLPVFYDVEPSDVRRQMGSFEEAFRIHKAEYITQPHLVETWQNALFRAANYSGFNWQSNELGSESRLISLIVKEVLSKVMPKELYVTKYPVGLDSRVKDVCSLLMLESDYHVRFIGIWGMGGSGKTVIAKALYNKILQSFDSSCFLANVREHSQQPNGLVHLQEILISDLLMRTNVKVSSVYEGINMIRERLCLKKVLIVLDDLDELSQVGALAGNRDWFGPGSTIIITTRNQHLLSQVTVDERYEPKALNVEESLELFSWHSLKTKLPDHQLYGVIADKIVAYTCGLPLALEVLGSYLFGRSIQQWDNAFDELQKHPPSKIQEILKINYDGLDYQTREIFLDIACFFIGVDIDCVIEILNGCYFHTEVGIRNLIDRCLLTVDENNELRMHDLLRDMGREIVRQEFPREPSKRSRLWNHQDIMDVLMGNKGTEAIEGVSVVSPVEAEIHLNTENFARMRKLRLLRLDNVNLHGSFEHLSMEIRWISWKGCSLKHLPSNWQMQHLVVLDMQYNKMTALWQGLKIQLLTHLKILNLSHSKCLKSTPEFNSVPSLVTLIMEGCTSLAEIDPSIGCLDSLLVLNLRGCENVKNIPSEICRLRLLGYLNVSGCSSLKELPDKLGDIESLWELYADETAIKKLPSSLTNLQHLTSVSLRGCTKISAKRNITSIGSLCFVVGVPFVALRRLNLRDCNLSDEDIPENIGWYSTLVELDLAGNSLRKLPDSFRELTNIESLWLDNWRILQSIPKLPPNLEALVAKNIH